jgi:hypothetical protein
VSFLGITVAPSPVCIVTEFVDGDNLDSLLRSTGEIADDIKMKIVKGISLGMRRLHSAKIVVCSSS